MKSNCHADGFIVTGDVNGCRFNSSQHLQQQNISAGYSYELMIIINSLAPGISDE